MIIGVTATEMFSDWILVLNVFSETDFYMSAGLPNIVSIALSSRYFIDNSTIISCSILNMFSHCIERSWSSIVLVDLDGILFIV